jgi:hypothetical protein
VLQAGMSIFRALKKNPGSSQRDLLRRRRRERLLTNIVIISVLSIVAALVITWQSQRIFTSRAAIVVRGSIRRLQA